MGVTRILDLMVLLLLATVILLPRPDASVKPALALDADQRARIAELQSVLVGRPGDVDASLELAKLFLDGRRPDWTLATVSPALARHPNDYRLHQLRAIAYADRFEGKPASEAAERAFALCEQTPAPAGVPPCGEAVHARLSLLSATLAKVANVDMKKYPYIAKDEIYKSLHPTFIPKPKTGTAGKTGKTGKTGNTAPPSKAPPSP